MGISVGLALTAEHPWASVSLRNPLIGHLLGATHGWVSPTGHPWVALWSPVVSP